jgi:hypothetical protein
MCTTNVKRQNAKAAIIFPPPTHRTPPDQDQKPIGMGDDRQAETMAAVLNSQNHRGYQMGQVMVKDKGRTIPRPTSGDRRTAQERLDAQERAETLSIALNQPHRRGNDDKRLSDAFGRFCLNHKPRPLGDHCYHAGNRYAEIVREAKNALGLTVIAWSPSDGGYMSLTPDEIQARRDLALSRKREADEVLRAIMPRLPGALERLVYDLTEPNPYDEGILAHGLDRLARSMGLKERNINETT